MMSLEQIIAFFKQLVMSAYANRNRADRWSGWLDVYGSDDQPTKIELEGKYKSVSVEATGAKFIIDLGQGQDLTVEIAPGTGPGRVSINGEVDPQASPVVQLKGTWLQPARTALDIRPVTFHGHDCRFNLRFLG